jgi:hypothetical protein
MRRRGSFGLPTMTTLRRAGVVGLLVMTAFGVGATPAVAQFGGLGATARRLAEEARKRAEEQQRKQQQAQQPAPATAPAPVATGAPAPAADTAAAASTPAAAAAGAASDQQSPGPAAPLNNCTDEFGKPCITVISQDGYDEIDWNGPDIVSRSPLDFPCFSARVEMERFKRATAGIASSVPARSLTYPQALTAVQGLFSSGNASKALAEFRMAAKGPAGPEVLERTGILAALQGDLPYTLAALLTRHEASSNDPTALFNLASALTYAGMPNEAIAMLDKIASTGAKPDVAFAIQPQAALDYLRGYDLLLTGKLGDSQSLLSRAFTADPTLTDASYALAIAEQAQGSDPRKHMLQGRIRSYSGPWIYCGDKYALDPLVHADDDKVGPPADQLFNLSKGTPGVLPQLRHPLNGEQLLSMMEKVGVESQKLMQEAISYSQRADAILENQLAPRLRSNPSLQDLTDQALYEMLDEGQASLKPLQRMRLAREARDNEMQDAIERDVQQQKDKYMRLAQMVDSDDRRDLARDMVATSLSRRRVSINAWDTALRQQYRAWHKYATGLAGYMTDETWRQYADLRIKAWGATQWVTLYSGLIGGYARAVPVAHELYAPPPPLPEPPGPPDQSLWRCEPQMERGLSRSFTSPSKLGAPDVKMSASMDCDKAALRVDSDLASSKLSDAFRVPYERQLNDSLTMQRQAAIPGAGLVPQPSGSVGVFGEVSVARRTGDVTVYAGPKAEISGIGEVRDGAYATRDSDGIKEFGIRVDPPKQPGADSGLKQFDGDGMKFTIWSAPPRPPRFNRAGMPIWSNK